ncbi:MAG TPA: L,D-transpeptidase family protein [Chitinophagales bacterium]|nr:L,D-transpeptidase family protein [Chitinophagales bacterium]
MAKKVPTKFIAITAVIIVLVTVELIFKRPFFGSAKDRIHKVLAQVGRIKVGEDSVRIASRDFLQKYYEHFGYIQNEADSTRRSNRYHNMLLAMLQQADELGLNPADYHDDYIRRYDSLSKLPGFDAGTYELENEVVFDDAAISFLYHVAYGKEIPVGFNGVKYSIDSARILNVFNGLVAGGDWRKTVDSLEPKTMQYTRLKRELNNMQAFMRQNPAVDSVQGSNTLSRRDITLKLAAYGVLNDSVNADSVSDAMFNTAVKGFQQMVGLDATGKVDEATIAKLNFPLKRRIEQLKESLNYWRWTGRLREQEFILVNIPSARLQIVNSDTAHDITMKVIVGKTATQTPEFTAYINKVVTYPYWVVPFSIATKEMLPKIRKRISYLDDNNLQVINGKGEEVDPQRIDWNRYSEHYFPYTIRQSTGCDNSLGLLKFDVNSPYSIYLHDTNHKELFLSNDRFMSHGCIRLEKPMVLADFLLQGSLDSATRAELNECVKGKKPAEFKLKKLFPVLIFYMTADVDEKGNLRFYKDVYSIETPKAVAKKVA